MKIIISFTYYISYIILIFQMLTDYCFYNPLYKSLQYMIDRIPVYVYKFSYIGQYSYYNSSTGNDSDYGAVHGDDLIYLFDNLADFPGGFNTNDELVSDVLVFLLTQFAKLDDIDLAKCSDMRPMCQYSHFYKNASGLFDLEETSKFDMESVELWDHFEEISGHQSNAGRSKRQTNDESTTEVFGVIRYAPEESNDETRVRPSRKGRFNDLRDILKDEDAELTKK